MKLFNIPIVIKLKSDYQKYMFILIYKMYKSEFFFLEVKLDVKGQLILSLEGNTICEKNQKYSTDLTFVCNKNVSFKI